MIASTTFLVELPGPRWVWAAVLWAYLAGWAVARGVDAYISWLRWQLDRKKAA